PGHEELALGAIASGGVLVLNPDVVQHLGVDPAVVQRVMEDETQELARRERVFRGNRPALDVAGKIAILVDDGLATGATMRSAIEALRQMSPAKVIAAVPVGAAETCEEFRDYADEVICARTPEPFFGVGMWYEDFAQVSDEEVKRALDVPRG